MISKNFYLNLVFRVLIIILASLTSGWFLFQQDSYAATSICLLIVIITSINLIRFLNHTNRRLSYFFDSVRNDDSTLSFTMEAKSKTLKELDTSLSRLNQHIQQIKIENQQQEQYFHALLEQVATGIITYNKEGHILHANTSAKKLFSLEVLTHAKQIERVNKKLANIVATIQPFEQRLVSLPTERGNVQLSIKATSFKTTSGELILLSIQDIKNELDEKELDSWLKLIRVLMHEIMNSITPITSLSESLGKYFITEGKPIKPSDINEKIIQTTIRGLEVIREQGKGLMNFVESYRRLTRLPKPEKKPIRINELIHRAKLLLQSIENASNIHFEYQIEPENLEIIADENQISQVLINLVKNAVQANENNQNAVIKVIAAINAQQRAEICVIDNGPGIEENLLDEIFVPFFTTRENGSGIGLSISRQIMRLHGGNLKVKSTPGKETMFCMSF